jgi:hypothetical protein
MPKTYWLITDREGGPKELKHLDIPDGLDPAEKKYKRFVSWECLPSMEWRIWILGQFWGLTEEGD